VTYLSYLTYLTYPLASSRRMQGHQSNAPLSS